MLSTDGWYFRLSLNILNSYSGLSRTTVFPLSSLNAEVVQTWVRFRTETWFEQWKGWHLKNTLRCSFFTLASDPAAWPRPGPKLSNPASSHCMSCQVLLHKKHSSSAYLKFPNNPSVNHLIIGWEFITTVAPGTWLNKPTGCQAGGGIMWGDKGCVHPSGAFIPARPPQNSRSLCFGIPPCH